MTKLLHFTADWCQPCKKIKPLIDEFIIENPDIEYVKVDIEEEFEIAKEHNIMGIPTLIAIRNDSVIGRHTGMADMSKIKRLFE